MIDKTVILRNYHDHSVIITLAHRREPISGMIVDNSPEDHCVVVKDPHVVEYYETKKDSLIERVYFKDMTAIDYQ
jgi:hypothetical protein